MGRVQVFISYATEDRPIAAALYDEIATAGAVVFQFGRSETAGKPSWEEILAWIKDSDVFILLVSRSSVKSRPVKEELNYAHYCHINTDSRKPEKLIPAIIEAGADPPMLIEHFTRFDLTLLERGLPRLLTQLGLKRSVRPARKPDSWLPDPVLLFQQYKKKNPGPSEASRWGEKAEKIVTTYHALKPKEIPPSIGARHLQRILGEQLGKSADDPKNPLAAYDSLFLGVPTSQPDSGQTSGKKLNLSEFLLSYDSSSKGRLLAPLPVPRVIRSFLGIGWEAVAGASGYAVEESEDQTFVSPNEVYRGVDTHYSWKPGLPGNSRYYRVKAVGGVFRPDSPWSDAVPGRFDLATWKLTVASSASNMAAPRLDITSHALGNSLAWTTIGGASGYVLECSESGFRLGDGKVIYDGPNTSHHDTAGSFRRLTGMVLTGLDQIPKASRRSYRVKAKSSGGRPDSPWSNVVESDPMSRPLFSVSRKPGQKR